MQSVSALLKRVPTGLLINSEFVSCAEKLDVFDRSSGQVLTQIGQASCEQVDQAVQVGLQSYKEVWQYTSAMERQDFLYKLALKVEEHKNYISQLEVLDSGKPIA